MERSKPAGIASRGDDRNEFEPVREIRDADITECRVFSPQGE